MASSRAALRFNGKFLSIQPNGKIEWRDNPNSPGVPGAYETVELVWLDGVPSVAPGAPPAPVPAGPSIQPLTPGLSVHDQFLAWVADKPFGQPTLRGLEPTLLAHGWRLENANREGDITKLYTPDGNNYRVGFGEGHWVWIPWSGNH